MNFLIKPGFYRQILSTTNSHLCISNYLNVKNIIPFQFSIKKYSTNEKQTRSNAVIEQKYSKEIGEATPLEKVKETTKTASYLGVIIIGLGVTGMIFFATIRELFSSQSPNNIYSSAFDKCCQNTKLKDKLGEPIKAYGEETRRGRRQHVSHVYFNKDGINYLRMQFYMQGSRKKGTVHLEMKQINNKFEYNYLIIELEGIYKDMIVLEDNRNESQLQTIM